MDRSLNRSAAATEATDNLLVAFDHVLSNPLEADDGIRCERQAPQLAVVLPKPISGEDRGGAFGGGNGIGAAHGRMGAVQVSRFDFHVANTGFSSQPIFARE